MLAWHPKGAGEARCRTDARSRIIGLGYVGLPVAVAFGRVGAPVIGFDIDAERVHELNAGHDRTREVAAADLRHPSVSFTADASELKARRLLHRDGADPD